MPTVNDKINRSEKSQKFLRGSSLSGLNFNGIPKRGNHIRKFITIPLVWLLLITAVNTSAREDINRSQKGKVLILDFNEKGTEIIDSSSSKAKGRSFAGKDAADLHLTTGEPGLQFNGIDNFVTLTSPAKELDITGSIRMEALIYPAGQSKGRSLILGYGNDRARLWLNSKNLLYFEIWEGANPVKCYASPYVPVKLNEWYRVCGEYDKNRNTLSITVNGKRSSKSLFLTEGLLSRGRPWEQNIFIGGKPATTVGWSAPSANAYFQGIIKNIVIFNKAELDAVPQKTEDKSRADSNDQLKKTTTVKCEKQPFWTLENSEIALGISKTNGNIIGIWNKNLGKKYVETGIDNYWVENKKDFSISKSSELDDKIIDSIYNNNTLTLKCKNDNLKINIIKEYQINKNDQKLIKRISFSTANESDVFLLKYASRTTLTSAFVKQGYFHHLGITEPYDKPLIFPDEIGNKRNIYGASLVSFVNPGDGYGVGEYKYKINGQYDLASTRLMPSYIFTSGWNIGITGDFIKRNQDFSAEIHYVVFKGDIVDFHRKYMNLPAIVAIRESFKTPSWSNEARLVLGWRGAHGLGRSVPYDKLTRLLNKNEPVIAWPITPWSDWSVDVRGDCLDGESTNPAFAFYPIVQNELKVLKYVQENCPLARISVYVWPWSLGSKSKIYREHPEWAVYDEKGDPRLCADILHGTSYLANPAAPGYADYQMIRVKRVINKLKYEVYNTDGTGGRDDADWKTEKVVHNYHWLEYFGKLRNTLRECNKNIIYMPNGAFYVDGLNADCGFIEFGSTRNMVDPDDNNGPYNWRIYSIKIFFAKLYQYKDRWVSPLFWGHWSNKTGRRNNDPYYSNYIIALGLKPSCPAEADFREMKSPWLSLKSKMPYINAAYEMKNVEVVDGDISPCWWNERKTEIEAYTTRQANAGFIPVIGHNNALTHAAVSANLVKMGLPRGQELYSWKFEMLDPWKITAQDVSQPEWENKAVMKKEFLGRAVLKNDRKTFGVSLKPNLLTLIMVTASPAVIHSINGKRNQLLLPDTLGNHVEGRIDFKHKECILKTVIKGKNVKIMSLFPKNLGRPKITSTGSKEEIPYTEVNEFDERFLLFMVPEGKNEIRIKGQNQAPVTARTIAIHQAVNTPVIDGRITPGEYDSKTVADAFSHNRGGGKAKEQTMVFLSYDKNNLYIAFKCFQQFFAEQMQVSKHDGGIHKDDSIEIYLDTNLDRRTYYHFRVSRFGVTTDSECTPFSRNQEWNPQWNAKTSTSEGYWTAEIAIPFSVLRKNPKKDEIWGCNFCRATPKTNEWSMWNYINTSAFHTPSQFGRLIFK
ncbi:MAG: sugar-binding protein [Victivallaceae bacterium]|nr:sugar-binding protein [Victivallaceae bacterium]